MSNDLSASNAMDGYAPERKGERSASEETEKQLLALREERDAALKAVGVAENRAENYRAEMYRYLTGMREARAELAKLKDDQDGLVDQHLLIRVKDRASRAQSEVAKLRKAIEDAPHETTHDTPCYAGIVAFARCVCWKSKALTEKGQNG